MTHSERLMSAGKLFVKWVIGSELLGIHPCLFTGSVAFGEANETSDVDIVFPIMAMEDVNAKLKAVSISAETSDYNNGLHFFVPFDGNNATINLMFLHPLDYAVWSKATKVYPMLTLGFDRSKRHALFQSLCALIKTQYAVNGDFITHKNLKEYL